MALADIAKFQVREITEELGENEGTSLGNAVNLVKFLGTLKDSIAYSGEVFPQQMLLNSLGATSYQLIARMDDGREFWLIKTIDEPRKALYLAQVLTAVLP